MTSDLDLMVVGSINLDVSVTVSDLPVAGETVLGGDALWSPGGKGANQAVAAARLGRSVAMVGCVGQDPAGRDLTSGLAAEGINVSCVEALGEVPTGLALISVAAGGENSIVVSPGANGRLTPNHVEQAISALSGAKACLVQFEVPAEAVASVVEHFEGLLVVNPAPARLVANDVLARAAVVVPNQVELAALGNSAVAVSHDEVVDQARGLDVEAVVVTLGAEGALVIDRDSVDLVPSVETEVVDTTAAGDSFCAGLVDGLLAGESLLSATQWATRVAAVTVASRGAQDSLPTRREVEAS